jgi:hypothetical protein
MSILRSSISLTLRYILAVRTEVPTVAVRPVLEPSRQLYHLPNDPFQPEFEQWAIMDFE